MENINDKQNHIVDTNKMVSSVEWLSNQAYELFEQYSEGRFDRITLNKLMLQATEKAKKMEKEQRSIKLPSDEEINAEFTLDSCDNDQGVMWGLRKGAKWMRDKLQGGEQ